MCLGRTAGPLQLLSSTSILHRRAKIRSTVRGIELNGVSRCIEWACGSMLMCRSENNLTRKFSPVKRHCCLQHKTNLLPLRCVICKSSGP